ncbi:phosphotransferase enzyme family protein [Paractinoplanes abujensis]|uniref:Hydroxylysine kinase n=1 Tax=Paractinoplanes abujensis TaxID=882441 RepID=A0A7W7CTE3_9ACTN|nr:phosphotransferase [Actinoplanes abujensis]MBB4694377.1 homoserine kinase type II [Actinoplanes abujensis]
MPDAELLRSTLRDEWHLVPSEITALDDVLLSRGWEVTAGSRTYVVRLCDPGARLPVEAGLVATERLRARDIAAGEPVRTLSGSLTAQTEAGAFAVLHRVPGRRLDGGDPVDQQWWGDRLGAVHRALQGFHHPGLRSWQPLDAGAAHLDAEPWLRAAVTEAAAAATRLTITDRLTYGVLHGDPAPGVFVLDPGTGRAGLLDCGASGVGPLVYDVAAAVIYAGGVPRAAELLDGYLAAGPVEAGELEAALPVLLRLRWAVKAERAARRGCSQGLRRAREALESAPG